MRELTRVNPGLCFLGPSGHGTKCPGKRPSKEPSRRVRYDRAQLIPEVFLVEMCAVFLKEGFRIRNFVTPIIESVRTPARITPFPTGRLFGVALSQALRARLRSHRPSGTFRNRLLVRRFLRRCGRTPHPARASSSSEVCFRPEGARPNGPWELSSGFTLGNAF